MISDPDHLVNDFELKTLQDKISKTKINLVHYNLEEIFSYGAKVREIIDGHFFDGDPYLAEYKHMVTAWDFYPLALVLGTDLLRKKRK